MTDVAATSQAVPAARGTAALVLEVARHEVAVMLRTRRAVALIALYLAGAVVAGLGYVLMLRVIEKQALDALAASGMDPASAARAVSIAGQRGYAELVGFFAGVNPADLDPHLRDSLVLPALLWGSLAFLPFVVVLTTFDQLAGELSTRSILYTVLRVPRAVVLLGKLLAQLAVFTVLTAAASTVLVALAGLLLHSFVPLDAAAGLVRVVALLVPFGFCYLGITMFASAAARQPTLALFGAIGIMLVLRVLGWLAHVPTDSGYGWLRWLAYASPARYHAGLWVAGLSAPLASTAAYLALGGFFVGLAALRLEERDL